MKHLLVLFIVLGVCHAEPPRPPRRFSLVASVFPDTRTGGAAGGGFGSLAPLSSPDANTLAQSNGVTAQAFYVYGTVDTVASPTNYNRGSISMSAGVMTVGPQAGGTGPTGGIRFITSASNQGFSFAPNNSSVLFTISNTGTISSYKGQSSLDAVVLRGTNIASTGQVGNFGPTNVLTGGAGTAGLYEACFQASTTTSGTGTTGTVTLAWNDGNAKSFTTGTWALNAVDVTGQVNSCQTIRVAASQNVTVATTIGSIGTSVYRIDATITQLQ